MDYYSTISPAATTALVDAIRAERDSIWRKLETGEMTTREWSEAGYAIASLTGRIAARLENLESWNNEDSEAFLTAVFELTGFERVRGEAE